MIHMVDRPIDPESSTAVDVIYGTRFLCEMICPVLSCLVLSYPALRVKILCVQVHIAGIVYMVTANVPGHAEVGRRAVAEKKNLRGAPGPLQS